MFRDKSLISCLKYNNYRAVKRTINFSFSTKKSNLNGTDKVILFSFTFFKMQHQHFFFSDFKTNYLRTLRGYLQFSFWILIAPDTIYFTCIVICRAKLNPN